MNLLELFSGTGIMAQTFKEHGWDTLTVDNNPKFNPDIIADIRECDWKRFYEDTIPHTPDVIWASPPCQCFSIASCSTHWDNTRNLLNPKTNNALNAVQVVNHTLWLIQQLRPKYWFIENPRGMLRKMPFMRGLPRHTITYCQYGDTRMKPTDIWTNCEVWKPRPMCKNGDECHERAPRGAKTGTQGRKGALRAQLPKGLCEEIVRVCSE